MEGGVQLDKLTQEFLNDVYHYEVLRPVAINMAMEFMFELKAE